MQEHEELLETILDLAIGPAVVELSEEARQPIQVKAIALCADQTIEKSKCFDTGKSVGGVTAQGEARVLLKGSGFPCNFEVEAIFKGLSPDTGFSGFSMRGKAKREDGKRSIKLTGHSNRYNVWEWSRAFRGI